MSWGMLAPDMVISTRRQQNLGLATAVRYFNDQAVPGLGGMWFPMPIIWSVLAVSIAEELGRPALPVGNAVEALMMKHAKDGPTDRRVRGARKMQGLTDWSFRNLTRRGTYVVQPIRMAMVQPLVALGFVYGSRYGAFRIHSAGKRMLELPEIAKCRTLLARWAHGSDPRDLSKVISALSPTAQIPNDVRKLVHKQLLEGNDAASTRRRNLVAIGPGPSRAQLNILEPMPGIQHDHWTDLCAGAAFIDLRDKALAVLDALEMRLLELQDNNDAVRLSPKEGLAAAKDQIDELRQFASMADKRIKAAAEPFSLAFLGEILSSTPKMLLQRLAERDGSVITWRDEHLCLGPAGGDIKTISDPDDENTPLQNNAFAPQLFRLYNLHCLATELASGTNPGSSLVHKHEAA